MDTLMVSTDVLSEEGFNAKLKNGTLTMTEDASYEADKMCEYVDSLTHNAIELISTNKLPADMVFYSNLPDSGYTIRIIK